MQPSGRQARRLFLKWCHQLIATRDTKRVNKTFLRRTRRRSTRRQARCWSCSEHIRRNASQRRNSKIRRLSVADKYFLMKNVSHTMSDSTLRVSHLFSKIWFQTYQLCKFEKSRDRFHVTSVDNQCRCSRSCCCRASDGYGVTHAANNKIRVWEFLTSLRLLFNA